MLTDILARAVPEVGVKLVVVNSVRHFFIYVEPSHGDYWVRFKMKYPHWERVALKHKAVNVDVACPEFGSCEDLVDWITDVMNLPHGVSNLLRISVRSCL